MPELKYQRSAEWDGKTRMACLVGATLDLDGRHFVAIAPCYLLPDDTADDLAARTKQWRELPPDAPPPEAAEHVPWWQRSFGWRKSP